MKSYLAILILLLASCAPGGEVVDVTAIAAVPTVAPVEVISRAAEETVQPMDCVRIWLEVPPEQSGTIKYGCHPDPKLLQPGVWDNRTFLIFQAGQPGSYGIFVSWLDSTNQMKKYVIDTGGEPDPNPFPQPNPQPNPTPGKRKIIILEESSQRTAAQAKIILSQKLRSYLESKKHQFALKDIDQIVPPAIAPSSDLPRLIIEDGAGNVVYQCPLPETVDSVIETIKAHGG